MGEPARVRREREHSTRPRLKVVKDGRGALTSRPKKRAPQCAARQNCRAFVLLMAFIALLGVGRVWLSVQAAEASLEVGRLRETIKSERYDGDMLEVRQSALGSPSRIRRLAGKALNMAPAKSVSYLDISDDQPDAKSDADTAAADGHTGLSGAVARLLDLTAGEAQVLLVGDVGLAAAR